MKICYVQHVSFEDLGCMDPILRAAGHEVAPVRLYAGDPIPHVDDFDGLIIMGGPMGVGDEDRYPWLRDEKTWIEAAMAHGKIVLGICLGAQLIAEVMGARVYPGPWREIGWFDLERTTEAETTVLASVFPEHFEAFHWHGDTFDIPADAVLLASSEACPNQGFIAEDRILALQFHIETTPRSANALIQHCASELDGSRYVQSAEEILADPEYFTCANRLMEKVLSSLC